jgi:5'-nucleotidase
VIPTATRPRWPTRRRAANTNPAADPVAAPATVRRVRVLVTNDDGVEAPGLKALARALVTAGHDVVVVAPDGEHSGAGAGIGRLHRSGPIGRLTIDWADLPGVPVHALAAPPAATVYAGGLGAFGPAPDLVASGVNRGLNTGHLVLHSGTVGAALTAAVLGIPALAVSLAWGDAEHWDTAAALAATLVPAVPAHGVLSLNVPNVPLDVVRGVRGARLAPFAERWRATAPDGEVRLEYVGHDDEPAPDTDVAVVRAGFAAVTELTGITGVPASAAAGAAPGPTTPGR